MRAVKRLTSLQLKGGDTGTLNLDNTGSTTITDLNLTVPDSLKAYFTGDCLSVKSLVSGASCKLSYTIPKVVTAATGDVKVSGADVDNNPASLSITVSTLGHFEFEQSGKSINKLTLEPNATGTVSVKNTGGSDITDAEISNLNATGFTNVDCPTDSGTLSSGKSCTFNYKISTAPEKSDTTIVASGNNADNSPQNLSIQVSNGMNIRVENN